MFSQKYKIPIVCDNYLNIYDKCNIGCKFCKFNQNIESVKRNKINFDKYANQKVLVCYSVDPYPFGYDTNLVPQTIKQLHNHGCNVVFFNKKSNTFG